MKLLSRQDKAAEIKTDNDSDSKHITSTRESQSKSQQGVTKVYPSQMKDWQPMDAKGGKSQFASRI